VAAHAGKFDMKQSAKTIILYIKLVRNITEATEMLESINTLYGES
jgi:hypothetical protein